MDFAAPWAIGIAATLRLADHVEAGAASVEELARRTDADPATLARLLRYLVALGVFAEPAPGVIANTDVSRLLLDERGWRQWLDLDGPPGIWAESWTRLLGAVRTGSPGRDERWYYAELERSGLAASFDDLMAAQVRANAKQVAEVYDWSSVGRVVDVGGGTGTLLRTVLAAHPHLRGTLFELPEVAGRAEGPFEIVAGDAHVDPLPAADAYVLSQVLHGVDDEGALRILRGCAEGARILLVEGVIGGDTSPAETSFDLFMLTLSGGIQRTLDDFQRLAESTGRTVRSRTALATGNTLVELGPQRPNPK
jgi:2,7-dihydroxy-5-methyl-1-naphthoate 7-O-methyltransferase